MGSVPKAGESGLVVDTVVAEVNDLALLVEGATEAESDLFQIAHVLALELEALASAIAKALWFPVPTGGRRGMGPLSSEDAAERLRNTATFIGQALSPLRDSHLHSADGSSLPQFPAPDGGAFSIRQALDRMQALVLLHGRQLRSLRSAAQSWPVET